jgi:hypothetical protein
VPKQPVIGDVSIGNFRLEFGLYPRRVRFPDRLGQRRPLYRERLQLTSDLGGRLSREARSYLADIEQFATLSTPEAQRGDPAGAGHEADHDITAAAGPQEDGRA